MLVVLAVAPTPYPGSSAVIAVCAVGVFISAMRFSSSMTAPIKFAPVAGFLGTAMASATWSEVSVASLTGSGQLVIIAAVAWSAARSYSLEDFLTGSTRGLRLLLISSLLLALLVPSIGVVSGPYEAGTVKGVFEHRNLFGFVTVLAAISFWSSRGGRCRLLNAADVALVTTCLVTARSQSSFVVVAALIVVWVALKLAQRAEHFTRVIVVTAMTCGGSFALLWLIRSLAEVSDSLGRDATLTGRTVIWEAALQAASYNPLFGVGWDSAWMPGLPITNTIWSAIGFSVYQAHNGYLDIYLQIGLVGLFAFSCMLLASAVQAIPLAFRQLNPAYMWPALALFAMLIANSTESRFTTPIGWFMLSSAYFFSQPLRLTRKY